MDNKSSLPEPSRFMTNENLFNDSEGYNSPVVYVGSVSSDISGQDILCAFEKFGPIESVNIRSSDNHPSQYAFVRFLEIESAHAALDAGETICRHKRLAIRPRRKSPLRQPQRRAADLDSPPVRDIANTDISKLNHLNNLWGKSLSIANIPPDMNPRDLFDLFSDHGAVEAAFIHPYGMIVQIDKLLIRGDLHGRRHGEVVFDSFLYTKNALQKLNRYNLRGYVLEVAPKRVTPPLAASSLPPIQYSSPSVPPLLLNNLPMNWLNHPNAPDHSSFFTQQPEHPLLFQDPTKPMQMYAPLPQPHQLPPIQPVQMEPVSIAIPELDEPDDPCNLFVKNLDPDLFRETDQLKDLFMGHGNVVSAHLAVNAEREPRGFGFVSFSNPEEARAAKIALHGKSFRGSKVLYVNFAEKKEDRMKRLRDIFSRQNEFLEDTLTTKENESNAASVTRQWRATHLHGIAEEDERHEEPGKVNAESTYDQSHSLQ